MSLRQSFHQTCFWRQLLILSSYLNETQLSGFSGVSQGHKVTIFCQWQEEIGKKLIEDIHRAYCFPLGLNSIHEVSLQLSIIFHLRYIKPEITDVYHSQSSSLPLQTRASRKQDLLLLLAFGLTCWHSEWSCSNNSWWWS